MSPKVSICMPVYNCSSYISETIESVLAQDFSNFELLIVDNCSVDGTRDIIGNYVGQDGRVRFFRNYHNVGMVENWNLCLEKAQGDYIKFLFGDDILSSPYAVGKMVSLLDSHDNVTLVASARYLVDTNSSILSVLSSYTGAQYRGTDIIQDCLAKDSNEIGEPSVVMFRKRDASRGFDSKYKQFVDLEMWFCLLEKGDFYYIAEPLCSFRRHSDQQTEKNAFSNAGVEDHLMLVTTYLSKKYINLNWLLKEYLLYQQVYMVWKLCRKYRSISREKFYLLLSKYYNENKFLFYYPIFKIFRVCMKIQRYIKKYKNRVNKKFLFAGD